MFSTIMEMEVSSLKNFFRPGFNKNSSLQLISQSILNILKLAIDLFYRPYSSETLKRRCPLRHEEIWRTSLSVSH